MRANSCIQPEDDDGGERAVEEEEEDDKAAEAASSRHFSRQLTRPFRCAYWGEQQR